MIKKIQILYQGNVVITSKLRTIKSIKDLTGLDLREAKDFCDELYNSPNLPRVIDFNLSDPIAVKRILAGFPPEIKVSFKEEERNIKLLSLGIGELDDYRYSLEYYLGFETTNSLINNSLIIKEMVSILTKEQMIHLSNIIVTEFYGVE